MEMQLTNSGSGQKMKRKSVRFSESVDTFSTYSREDYDRTPDYEKMEMFRLQQQRAARQAQFEEQEQALLNSFMCRQHSFQVAVESDNENDLDEEDDDALNEDVDEDEGQMMLESSRPMDADDLHDAQFDSFFGVDIFNGSSDSTSSSSGTAQMVDGNDYGDDGESESSSEETASEMSALMRTVEANSIREESDSSSLVLSPLSVAAGIDGSEEPSQGDSENMETVIFRNKKRLASEFESEVIEFVAVSIGTNVQPRKQHQAYAHKLMKQHYLQRAVTSEEGAGKPASDAFKTDFSVSNGPFITLHIPAAEYAI
jgi:hypothetical protein